MAALRTHERVLFVGLVSEGTGIPRLVLHAWVLAEGGPRGNPLNIGPGRDYGTYAKAAEATIELLRTSRYAPILRAARSGNDQAVLRAIIASPWDAGHYAGRGGSRPGTLLYGTYARAKREADEGGGGILGPRTGLDVAGEAVGGAIVEPIERAAASIETWVEDRAKLALAYVGLTTAAVVLFVIGLQLATGAPGVGLKALRARSLAGQKGDIPF